MNKKKLSLTYRFLRLIGLKYPENEYGQVSLWSVVKRVCKTYWDNFLMKFFMDSWLLSPISPRKLRPTILRLVGAKVGRGVFVGSNVKIDLGRADLITIDDNVHITGQTTLLCHKKDLSNYYLGDDYSKLAYKTAPIHLCKGCSTGTGSLIMPGVTIGEGAIVGAYSLVTKDIPAWTIATGRPAKVIKHIQKREDEYSNI